MSLVQSPGVGCLVEFLLGNQPQLAWVLGESGGKLKAFTLNKREVSMPCTRVLPWAGPSYGTEALSRAEISDKLIFHQTTRNSLLEKIDPLSIWELTQGQIKQASAEWFAQLFWDNPNSDEIAAVGRKLLECKTHFKFISPVFEIHPEDVVEQRLAEKTQALVRAKLIGAGNELFRELWTAWATHKPEDWQPEITLNKETAEILKNILLKRIAEPDRQDNDTGLWSGLRKGLPEHPLQALILALKWGIVPPHFNHHLWQADYDKLDTPVNSLDAEICSLANKIAIDSSRPLSVDFFSIDAPETQDVDDALYIEETPTGSYILDLALARPVFALRPESAIFKTALHKASSLYLPEAILHMLPENLSTDVFSLCAGKARPILHLHWKFDQEGNILVFSPSLAWGIIKEKLSYEVVEKELDSSVISRKDLHSGLKLAKLLRAKRLKSGAVIVERNEPRIVLEGYPENTNIEIFSEPELPLSHLLVSEFMILANQSIGVFAEENSIPLVFRTQNIEIPHDIRGVWSTPEDCHTVVRQLTRTLLEIRPVRHASLAVSAYAPITSPLRRAVDMVNMMQIQEYLSEGKPLWGSEELNSILDKLSLRLEAVAAVQRKRPRYWKLCYLQQCCKECFFTGVVVEENSHMVTLSLPDIQLSVRVNRDKLGEKIYPGQSFQLKLGKIDPLTNDIFVLEAQEE